MSRGHTSDRHKPRCACAVLLREGKFCSFATRTFLWFTDVPSRKIKAALPMAKTKVQISEELLKMMHSTKWYISISECLQVWKQWYFFCSSYQEEPSSMSQTWKKSKEDKWLSECFLASIWEVTNGCRKGNPVSCGVLLHTSAMKNGYGLRCVIGKLTLWRLCFSKEETQCCFFLSAFCCLCFKSSLIWNSYSSDSFLCWTLIHT